MKLFACGYMDNSLRIFDLDNKAGPPKIIHDHNARITCLKFSSNFKFLYTCDEDGVILHYGRKKILPKDQKDQFPYTPLFKLQDQMDEILAIDTNQTLDMYVTLSRDGTIAVRCQRTSKLWVHFKMFCKR
jgi:WD40 repeat protein